MDQLAGSTSARTWSSEPSSRCWPNGPLCSREHHGDQCRGDEGRTSPRSSAHDTSLPPFVIWRGPTVVVEGWRWHFPSGGSEPAEDSPAVPAIPRGRLALEASADRAVDGRAGVLGPARADDRPGVVLGLQQAGDDAHLPFVDSDGGGFQFDDRGEVRGPDLAGHQVAHGGEGAGGLENRVAVLGEVGGGGLVHGLDAADQGGGVAELFGRLYLGPAHLLPPRFELGGERGQRGCLHPGHGISTWVHDLRRPRRGLHLCTVRTGVLPNGSPKLGG